MDIFLWPARTVSDTAVSESFTPSQNSFHFLSYQRIIIFSELWNLTLRIVQYFQWNSWSYEMTVNIFAPRHERILKEFIESSPFRSQDDDQDLDSIAGEDLWRLKLTHWQVPKDYWGICIEGDFLTRKCLWVFPGMLG